MTTQSRYKVSLNGDSHDFDTKCHSIWGTSFCDMEQDANCFGKLLIMKNYWPIMRTLTGRLISKVEDESKAREYLKMVVKHHCPGLVKIVDEQRLGLPITVLRNDNTKYPLENPLVFTYEAQLEPNINHYSNLLGVLTLMRYVEEKPYHVDYYYRLREFMSRSAALLLCSDEAVDTYGTKGHDFMRGSFALTSLKGFTLNKAFFDKQKNEWGIQLYVQQAPWFLYGQSFLNDYIKWTPEIYDFFRTNTDSSLKGVNEIKKMLGITDETHEAFDAPYEQEYNRI